MWKLRGLDRQLFEGAEAKIFEFLDIEPLMPPARLRISKLLGRPVMDYVWCDCIPVSLDEMRSTDLEVHGQTGNVIRFRIGRCDPTLYLDVWRGPARDAPADLVGVRLVIDEGELEDGSPRPVDLAFEDAWSTRHHMPWPCLDSGEDHPALEPLVRRHREWLREWEEQFEDRIAAANGRVSRPMDACMCQSGLFWRWLHGD